MEPTRGPFVVRAAETSAPSPPAPSNDDLARRAREVLFAALDAAAPDAYVTGPQVELATWVFARVVGR